MKPASVYLIGAGPGDPTLITVRGLQHLNAADVVVYDRLVHQRLLQSVKPEAEQIDVSAAAPRPPDGAAGAAAGRAEAGPPNGAVPLGPAVVATAPPGDIARG